MEQSRTILKCSLTNIFRSFSLLLTLSLITCKAFGNDSTVAGVYFSISPGLSYKVANVPENRESYNRMGFLISAKPEIWLTKSFFIGFEIGNWFVSSQKNNNPWETSDASMSVMPVIGAFGVSYSGLTMQLGLGAGGIETVINTQFYESITREWNFAYLISINYEVYKWELFTFAPELKLFVVPFYELNQLGFALNIRSKLMSF